MDRGALQCTGGTARERASVSACEREMAIDPERGDGYGEGPGKCTSASHNIGAFTDLTIGAGTLDLQFLLCWILDAGFDGRDHTSILLCCVLDGCGRCLMLLCGFS